jgi:hypothetical protein
MAGLLELTVFAAAAPKGHGVALKARKKSNDDDCGRSNQEISHVPIPTKSTFDWAAA